MSINDNAGSGFISGARWTILRIRILSDVVRIRNTVPNTCFYNPPPPPRKSTIHTPGLQVLVSAPYRASKPRVRKFGRKIAFCPRQIKRCAIKNSSIIVPCLNYTCIYTAGNTRKVARLLEEEIRESANFTFL